jgi:hypothetical protein
MNTKLVRSAGIGRELDRRNEIGFELFVRQSLLHLTPASGIDVKSSFCVIQALCSDFMGWGKELDLRS